MVPVTQRGSLVLTVLVLSNECAARTALSTTLQIFGFRVVEAASAAEAAHVMHQVPMAAFVVDLHLLQARAGLEFVDSIRQQPSRMDAPVFVVAGERGLEDREREAIARAGAHVFVRGQSPRRLAEEIHWRLFSESQEPE